MLASAATWHYVSLIAAMAMLLVLAGGQWFFYDEWAFLVPEPVGGLLAPHVGHWSTSPILITQAIRAVFGLSSYLPYVAVSIVAHLVLCHLLWRVMLRVGVNRWLAVMLALLLAVLGAGAENIFWAFQVGFVGAIALGVAVLLIVDRAHLTRGWIVTAIALSVWSLTFSGTAIPVLLAGGLVALARHGWRRTVLIFAPSAVVYAAWYLLIQRPSGSGTRLAASSPGAILVDSPEYFGHYLVDGLGAVIPIPGMGAIAVFCLGVWAILTFPRWRGVAAPAYALAAAAVVQGILVSVSRVQLGPDSASAERYVYALVALLLPAIGLAFGWFARGRNGVTLVLVALTAIVGLYNLGLLGRAAVAQSARETQTQDQVYAALAIVTAPGASYPSSLQPLPVWAPDLTVGDLIGMYEAGWITPAPYTEAAMLTVRTSLDLSIAETDPPSPSAECTTIEPGESLIVPSQDITLAASTATVAYLAITQQGATGDARAVSIPSGGAVDVHNTSGLSTNVSVTSDAGGSVDACG